MRARTRSRSVAESPAVGLVATGALSVQFGAAIATKLFHRVGPAGAVTLRLGVAAVVLIIGWGVAKWIRQPALPDTKPVRRAGDIGAAVAFGVVMAAMNLSFYESIDRIPLGVAVTIEFSGPLALALVGSRRWLDGLWAVAAGAGVALLASGAGKRLDRGGLALALLAGCFWIGYILLSRQTGMRFGGLSGLTLAMVVASLAVLPFGLSDGAARLGHPSVLLLGGAVAMLSSVVPYSLELIALRRVTPRAFGVMLSLDPAMAAAAGVVVLGQNLTGIEWAALVLVVSANLGNTLSNRRQPLPAGPSDF